MFKVVCFRWRERARSNGKTALHIDREAAIEKVRPRNQSKHSVKLTLNWLGWLPNLCFTAHLTLMKRLKVTVSGRWSHAISRKLV